MLRNNEWVLFGNPVIEVVLQLSKMAVTVVRKRNWSSMLLSHLSSCFSGSRRLLAVTTASLMNIVSEIGRRIIIVLEIHVRTKTSTKRTEN